MWTRSLRPLRGWSGVSIGDIEFAEFRAVAVHDLYITCHLTTLVPLYVRL
jgi:hypothetical protein